LEENLHGSTHIHMGPGLWFVRYQVVWDKKTVTGSVPDGVCRTVMGARGCAPGEKMQFTVHVEECVDSHLGIGMVDSQYSCRDETINCFGRGRGIAFHKRHTNNNVTMLVDRTDLSDQTVKFYFQDLTKDESWRVWDGTISTINPILPDPKLTWYPAVSMFHASKVTIIPNPISMTVTCRQ
jgi:hypothetical protein